MRLPHRVPFPLSLAALAGTWSGAPPRSPMLMRIRGLRKQQWRERNPHGNEYRMSGPGRRAGTGDLGRVRTDSATSPKWPKVAKVFFEGRRLERSSFSACASAAAYLLCSMCLLGGLTGRKPEPSPYAIGYCASIKSQISRLGFPMLPGQRCGVSLLTNRVPI